MSRFRPKHADTLPAGSREPVTFVPRFFTWLILVVSFGLLVTRAAPLPPGAVDFLWRQAAAAETAKSYATAVESYELIAGLCPNETEPLLAIGNVYLTQHRWLLAQDAFNRALARRSNDARAAAGLANAKWGLGERSEAKRWWQTALEYQPQLNQARLRLGLAYFELGDLQVAEETLILALDEDIEASGEFKLPAEDAHSAHLYLASLLALRDPAEARRQLAYIPDDTSSPIVADRDYLWAALDYSQAASSEAEASKRLGLALVQMKEWRLAYEALQQASQLAPKDMDTQAYLGYVQGQLSLPGLARIKKSVTANPEWALGHYLQGLYMAERDLVVLAAGEFVRAQRLDPRNPQIQVALGYAYLEMGKYLEADNAFQAAVKAAPDDLTFHLILVRFYADRGYHVIESGLPAARAAEELAPDDAQVQDLLGWMYVLAGDPQQGRQHLVRALQLEPELASGYYHLGMVYTWMGEEDAAREAFERVIDLDTQGLYRDRAQTALREKK